jgi:beta-glucosidase
VLLKNDEGAVPIPTGSDVYVAGSDANNNDNQAGGWTPTWQGDSNNPKPIPGTTILKGASPAPPRRSLNPRHSHPSAQMTRFHSVGPSP